MAKKKKDKQDEAVSNEEQLNEGEGQNETLEENAQDQQIEQDQTQAQDSASGENTENQQHEEGQGDPLEIVPQARYVGNSPVRVAQSEKTVMLWPNQVYKNLQLTEDVQALLKRRKLEKVA